MKRDASNGSYYPQKYCLEMFNSRFEMQMKYIRPDTENYTDGRNEHD